MKQKTEIMKSILILTVILPTVLLLGCIIDNDIDNEEPPKLTWVKIPGQVLVNYHYSGARMTGYSAYARFENEGGSGRIEIKAMIMRGKSPSNEMTEHFDVEEGRTYTLVIEGDAGGGTPCSIAEGAALSYSWDLVIDSPSADSRWEVSLGSGYYRGLPYRSIKTIKLTDGNKE